MAKQAHNGSDRRHLLSAIVLAVAALLIFTGWMRLRNTVVSVRAESVTRQDISSVISTNGKIEPVRNFEAHAPAPATVRKVLVTEGTRVKPGQLLVQLDDAEARAQAAKALAALRAAEADLQAVKSGGTHEEVLTTRADLQKAQAERDDARRNFQAVQKLQQTGAASPAEVEAAQNRLKRAEADAQLLEAKQSGRYSSPEVARVEANAEQARAAYAAAQDLIRNTNIQAPFTGTVYQLPVKEGSYVQGGELLVAVANLEKVQVRAFVDEPEIGRLAVGQKVEVKWDAVPGRTWEGTLTRVPSVVTMVGTRTVGEVTCEIDNSDRKLLPNVNVNVAIVAARHNGTLTVSREAVHDIEGKRYVYQIDGQKLQAQEVQTGLSSLTRVEITKGVTQGEQIALGAVNAAPLRTGMEIKVVER
ncbi:MAG TPA: efflux RND transporter periplasmic adaptor subunit [Candidatus Limnocylindrales bacterium]|jgi:HlyD family secretion protein|nr:efflux RND transporter periplasmic adaptor subunit [Candidatus Limnocylindrales bacterium]